MRSIDQPDDATLRAGDVHFFTHKELFGGQPQKFEWRVKSQSWGRKGWNTSSEGMRAQGWTYAGDLAYRDTAEIPDLLIRAATALGSWMRANNVTHLAGLSLRDQTK